MMMKSVFWWRKPEYPEETTDLPEERLATIIAHIHRGLILFCKRVQTRVDAERSTLPHGIAGMLGQGGGGYGPPL